MYIDSLNVNFTHRMIFLSIKLNYMLQPEYNKLQNSIVHKSHVPINKQYFFMEI